MKLRFNFIQTQLNQKEERIEKILGPGEKFIYNKTLQSQKITIDFKIRGFKKLQGLNFDLFNGKNAIENMILKDPNENRLLLRMKYANTPKRPVFSLYCDYFLVDHSDFPITIARRTDSRLSLMPGFSRSDNLEDEQLPDLRIYPMDDSFKKDIVLYKDKYSDYHSDIIPIGLLGSSITRIQVPGVNKLSSSSLLDLAIETKKIKTGLFYFPFFANI